jgi:hypothetical protein
MDKDQPPARGFAAPGDPGFIYIIEHANRYKIGRSKNKVARIKAAKTWLPDRDVLIDGFTAFSDTDRDKNSRDFIYWFNGDGMAEFVQERYSQGLTLPKFLRQESEIKRKP